MMKNRSVLSTRFVTTIALLWVFLILSGCIQPQSPTLPSATDTPGATEEAPVPGENTALLENSKWHLTLFGAPDAETPVVAGSTITLEFSADGKAGGSAGCNTYGGSYEVQGDQLLFGEMVSTLMACADAAVMEQEMVYLAALQSASRFEVTDGMLKLWYDDEQGVLVFAAE